MRRGALVAFALLAVGVALLETPDLDAGDQFKTANYLLYAWHTGDWWLPRDRGEPATKPPLTVWLAGAASLATGGPSVAALRAPAALAALALVLATAALGEALGDERVGAIAGVAVAANASFLKLAAFARPDMPLAASIACALACFAASQRERPPRLAWLGFWASLGLGTLAKGPVALAIGGLAAAGALVWSPRRGAWRALRPAPGLLVLVATVGLWLVPALLRSAREVWDVLVVRELFHHVVDSAARGAKPHAGWSFVAELFARTPPWSLLLPAALAACAAPLREARAGGRAASGPALPAAWLATGLAVFLLPAQKRADYAIALAPAVALLVAFLLARRPAPGSAAARLSDATFSLLAAGLAVVFAASVALAFAPGAVASERLGRLAAAGPRVAATAAGLAAAGALAAWAWGRDRGAIAAVALGACVLGASAFDTVVLRAGARAAVEARDALLREARAEARRDLAVLAPYGRSTGAASFALGRIDAPPTTPRELLRVATEARAHGAALRVIASPRDARALEERGLARRRAGGDALDWVVLDVSTDALQRTEPSGPTS